MPWCCGTSGSVRARQIPQSARSATEVHTFWPVSRQPPSTRSARVRSEARSEPEPGLGEQLAPHQLAEQRRRARTARAARRCRARGSSGSAQPAITMSGRVTPARASSWSITIWVTGVGAEPVRRRPVRRQVAGLDQRRAPVVRRQRGDPLGGRPDLGRGPARRGPPRSTLDARGVRRRRPAPVSRSAAASAVADQRPQRRAPGAGRGGRRARR